MRAAGEHEQALQTLARSAQTAGGANHKGVQLFSAYLCTLGAANRELLLRFARWLAPIDEAEACRALIADRPAGVEPLPLSEAIAFMEASAPTLLLPTLEKLHARDADAEVALALVRAYVRQLGQAGRSSADFRSHRRDEHCGSAGRWASP